MARDNDRQRLFTRRALLVAGGQGLLLAALGGRLYQLQVVESERYVMLADDNRIDLKLFAPPRGRIVDRFGRALAVNRDDYRLLVVAEQAGDVSTTLDSLATLVEIDESDRERVLREIGRARKFVPVTVRDNLAWTDVARVEVNSLDLPGVSIDEGTTRVYPYGEVLAHVLGYVAPVAEGDAVDDPLLHLPDFRIGKGGVEKVHERALRGVGGSAEVEVNAVGRPIRELGRKDGKPGRDVRLTIDLDLQRLADERLGDESGAIVAIDVQTGYVLALVSSPGFDPNSFSHGISLAEWRSLTRNPKAPLINKAIAGQYAPGSTFKPIVGMAALTAGVMSPSTSVTCRGSINLGANTFHCWKRGGHGTVSLREALTQSCNVYFYEAARRAGINRIAAMGRIFGLGAPTGIDLPHERGALMPTEEWKQKVYKTGWSPGETIICGIGQGYVLTTPLQLAVMTARIASGLAVTPRIAFPLDADPADAEVSAAAPQRLAAVPQADPRGHDRGGGARNGGALGHPPVGIRDGGQDRHLAGAPDQQGRAGPRRHQERAPALGEARPRAVHRLRAGGGAPLRGLGDRRARRRRLEGRGTDRPRRAAGVAAADRGAAVPAGGSGLDARGRPRLRRTSRCGNAHSSACSNGSARSAGCSCC